MSITEIKNSASIQSKLNTVALKLVEKKLYNNVIEFNKILDEHLDDYLIERFGRYSLYWYLLQTLNRNCGNMFMVANEKNFYEIISHMYPQITLPKSEP